MKIPKYRFVYEDLLKMLESKKSKYGKIIPTEKKLCEKYSASRITIRHALNLLKDDLRIETIQGKGSIVAANPRRIKKIEYESIAKRIISKGCYPGYDILKFENIINNHLSNRFNKNESLIKFRRVRSYENHPFLISDVLILNKKLKNIDRKIFENPTDQNLINILKKNLKFKYNYNEQIFYSSKLDKIESTILREPIDSPSLIIEWFFFDNNDKLLFIDKETLTQSVKFKNFYI